MTKVLKISQSKVDQNRYRGGVMSHGGKREGAGRPKGSKGKQYQKIVEKLSELGCDPLTGMAEMLESDTLSDELRFKILEHLSNKIYPKVQPTDWFNFKRENLSTESMIDI